MQAGAVFGDRGLVKEIIGRIRAELAEVIENRLSLIHRHEKDPPLIPLLNFFTETLRETLEESNLSQAEIARRCGIPAPHLTQRQLKLSSWPEFRRPPQSESALRFAASHSSSPKRRGWKLLKKV